MTEAKARFSEVVERALGGEPQQVVRHGRQRVTVVDSATYEHLARPKRSLVALFSALRGSELDLDHRSGDARDLPKF
ncbi:MAG: type II toxin-antitoxin system prevent-host-death family antitoxin [Vulcanimicrobiaceae bacterium]